MLLEHRFGFVVDSFIEHVHAQSLDRSLTCSRAALGKKIMKNDHTKAKIANALV